MPWRPLLPDRKTTPRGTVYLLHFDQPFGHAQHYIGFSTVVDERLTDQLRGSGAKLVQHVIAAGINIRLAAEFVNATLRDEMRFKNRGGARKWCPICQREHHGQAE